MLQRSLVVPRSGSLASPMRLLEISELASKRFALGEDIDGPDHAVEIVSFFPAAYENMVPLASQSFQKYGPVNISTALSLCYHSSPLYSSLLQYRDK